MELHVGDNFEITLMLQFGLEKGKEPYIKVQDANGTWAWVQNKFLLRPDLRKGLLYDMVDDPTQLKWKDASLWTAKGGRAYIPTVKVPKKEAAIAPVQTKLKTNPVEKSPNEELSVLYDNIGDLFKKVGKLVK